MNGRRFVPVKTQSMMRSRPFTWTLTITCALAVSQRAAAQLVRQNVPVDLGSGAITGTLPFDEPFNLTGSAPPAVMHVRLWYIMDDSIPTPAGALADTMASNWCRRLRQPDPARADTTARGASSPVDRPLQSLWSRSNLDSIAGFSLRVMPLEPNTDYTFCFHVLRQPTQEAADAFTSRLTASLLTTLWRHVIEAQPTTLSLDSLQGLLRGALPAADSIDYGDAASLFAIVANESEDARTARLDRINVFITTIEQYALNRDANIADMDSHAVRISQLLLVPGQNHRLLLQRLTQVANALGQTTDEKVSFTDAARAALSIATINDGQAGRVARGIQTIDSPLTQQRTMALDTIRSSQPLRPVVSNLERSLRVIHDLSNLLHLLEVEPARLRQLGVTATDVRDLSGSIRQIELALGTQLRNAQLYIETLDTINRTVTDLARSVTTIDFARILLIGTTSATYQARAKMYLGLDVGLVGARHVHSVVPYFGVNVYLRPVNKGAPLRTRDSFSRRFALLLGLTVSSISEEDEREDLFSGHSAVIGAGVRVTDYWRIAAGALVFRSYTGTDEDRRLRIDVEPAVSASIDLDILSLFGKVGSLLFPIE